MRTLLGPHGKHSLSEPKLKTSVCCLPRGTIILLVPNKLIQWDFAPCFLDNSHSLIFCLPFPAFRAINPSVISSWRQPGVGNDNGQSLKIHPCGLEIHLCVGKYTSAVGICTKTTFPHFLVSFSPTPSTKPGEVTRETTNCENKVCHLLKLLISPPIFLLGQSQRRHC